MMMMILMHFVPVGAGGGLGDLLAFLLECCCFSIASLACL
jgi:hypothetical protein